MKKVLTPSGVKCLMYFMTKDDYHIASISEVKRNVKGCPLSISVALDALTEAKILKTQRTGKMILYMRNPDSKALNAFEAFVNMVEEKDD
jgi:uncharacterized protein with GYD domain